jgi:hypothetical protein
MEQQQWWVHLDQDQRTRTFPHITDVEQMASLQVVSLQGNRAYPTWKQIESGAIVEEVAERFLNPSNREDRDN